MLSVTNKYVLLLIALFWFTSAQACYDESLSDKTNFDNCQAEAKQGHAYAQFNLGYMYRTGKGVPHSYKLAFKWYTKAAEQGLADAQNLLGYMYSEVEGDYNLAFKWYTKAAKQGHAYAQFNLGYMYRTGKGVPHSYKLAFKWYTKAAEQGDDYAQNNLGFMYDTGQGVIQDYELSHMWFNIAAANGNKVAIENRDGVAKKMTPAQIERAHDMASDWVANHSD